MHTTLSWTHGLGRPELLAPAGTPEKLRTALLYGADAVYLGGSSLHLRAGSGGFARDSLDDAVRRVRAVNARVYYCLNSFPREADLRRIPGVIEEAAACGVDAFIVADPGMFRLARRHAPGIDLHVSTQANTGNSQSALFWAEAGACRVNLARELSWRDIRALRLACPEVELEAFVHGAMCLALSGQCLLSAWINRRPANQGRCTQPCRFEYREWEHARTVDLEEAKRPGEALWTAVDDSPFSSLWAPDDLCLLPWLSWFFARRIQSLKIEGRMKSAAYAAIATDVYATMLRRLAEGLRVDRKKGLAELHAVSSRPLGTGFFLPLRRRFARDPETTPGPILAHVVEGEGGAWRVLAHDAWEETNNVELIVPGLRRPLLRAGQYALENHRGERSGRISCGTTALLHADHPELRPGIFIRAAS